MTNPLAQFYLGSSRAVAELTCLEISHPSFSRTYYIVRNKSDGVTVIHEDGLSKTYEYYPLRVSRSGASNDLDSSLNIDLGDLGDLVSSETDRVRAASTFATRPTVKLRIYRSDSLTAPIFGPFIYEATSFAMKREGTSFTAAAPTLNVVKTGQRYMPSRFPMLRGML